MGELRLTPEEGDGIARVRRRRRVRGGERMGVAIDLVSQALQPLSPEARTRVIRAVVVLFDLEPKEG